MCVGVDRKQNHSQTAGGDVNIETDREATEIYFGFWHTLHLGQPNQLISASTNDILVETLGVGMELWLPQ